MDDKEDIIRTKKILTDLNNEHIKFLTKVLVEKLYINNEEKEKKYCIKTISRLIISNEFYLK